MATKKKAPAKKEVESQETTQPVEKEESQGEKTSEETTTKESRRERCITILNQGDSEFLSGFAISRSALSRAIIRGSMEFVSQFTDKNDITEAQVTEALQAKLR